MFLGKVLVNCMMGMSRSSTCVLAYLMLKKDMTALDALQEVRRHREIRPNDGFLRQLADLDNKLKKEREKKLQEDKAVKNVVSKPKTKPSTSCLSSSLSSNGRKTPQSVTWK